MDNVDRFPILRITKEGATDAEDMVTKELSLTIVLNNRELATLLCSPTDLEYLAIGFLASEGLIKGKDEIKKITVDDQKGVVRVETSPTDIQEAAKVESQTRISAVEIFALVKEFQHRSQIFRATGGVHSAALCDTKSILLFSEDIGRHNAIDKIFGQCILRGIPTDDRILITSGRISSEILLKVTKRDIPIIISKSAPTNLGVKLANDWGVTVIGFVRGERMNVYTNGWRIVTF